MVDNRWPYTLKKCKYLLLIREVNFRVSSQAHYAATRLQPSREMSPQESVGTRDQNNLILHAHGFGHSPRNPGEDRPVQMMLKFIPFFGTARYW
jgi:hypothetical protein